MKRKKEFPIFLKIQEFFLDFWFSCPASKLLLSLSTAFCPKAGLVRWFLINPWHVIRCHAIALWMVIILSTGKMHCCIYVTMLIIFLMEGPLRLVIATPILKITRRKGLYLFICASAFCFLGKNSVLTNYRMSYRLFELIFNKERCSLTTLVTITWAW